jgi:hypothetical protein
LSPGRVPRIAPPDQPRPIAGIPLRSTGSWTQVTLPELVFTPASRFAIWACFAKSPTDEKPRGNVGTPPVSAFWRFTSASAADKIG